MNKLSLSYSSASRFKQCPKKYYLSKKYSTKRISSALPFGKAVEEGVMAILKGASLEEANCIFEQNWKIEDFGKPKANNIFDNPLLEFYASDFDNNLILENDQRLFQEWLGHLGLNKTWEEVFELVASKLKEKKRPNLEELTMYNRILWQCCFIRGKVMLESFYTNVLPRVEYVVELNGKLAFQKKIEFIDESGDEIVGYADVVLKLKDFEKPIVFDLKTAAYKYTFQQLNTSEQLRTYSANLQDELKSTAAGYIVLIKKVQVNRSCDQCGAPKEGLAKICKECGKGRYIIPKFLSDTQLIYKEFDPEELEDVLADYEGIVTAIKSNVCFKNTANCYMYNRECEFYPVCWNKKDPEEVENLIKKKESA